MFSCSGDCPTYFFPSTCVTSRFLYKLLDSSFNPLAVCSPSSFAGALTGSSEAGAGEMRHVEQGGVQQGAVDQQEGSMSAGSLVMALIVAVVAVALAGGLAYAGWQEYKRRQVRPFSQHFPLAFHVHGCHRRTNL